MSDFIVAVANKFLELRVTKEENNIIASDVIIVEERSKATKFNSEDRMDLDMLCRKLNKSDLQVNTSTGPFKIREARIVNI